jgi:predicted nucleic-acid-binding Zn-ribbon protein
MAQARQQNAPYQTQPQAYVQPQQYNHAGHQPVQQQFGQLPVTQQVPQQPQPPPEVTIDNLFDAMKFWKGGPGAKTDPDPCPNCGSNQYFSRAVSRRGPAPAPHCYNCGYNDGMFTQGEATTWGMTG